MTGNLQRIIDGHNEKLLEASALGVAIVAGSDAGSCGVPHGIGLLTELALMQRAGLTPVEVLTSATARSAEKFQYSDRVGRLAAGYCSRMLFTVADPTEDVTNLFGTRILLMDGQAVATDGLPDEEGL